MKNMSEHDQFEGLLHDYLSGNLPEEQAEELEIHLLGCPLCHKKLNAAEEESMQHLVTRHASEFRAVLGCLDQSSAESRALDRTGASSRSNELRMQSERVSPRERIESFWNMLLKWRIPQLYAPIAAAATLIAIILWPSMPPLIPWNREVAIEDPMSIIVDNTRGGDGMRGGTRPKQMKPSPTAREAALNELGRLIQFDLDSGSFMLAGMADVRAIGTPSSRHTVSVRLVTPGGALIRHHEAEIFAQKQEARPAIKLWAIALPSMTPYAADLEGREISLQWTEAMGPHGCLTLTYGGGNEYYATGAISFMVPSVNKSDE